MRQKTQANSQKKKMARETDARGRKNNNKVGGRTLFDKNEVFLSVVQRAQKVISEVCICAL